MNLFHNKSEGVNSSQDTEKSNDHAEQKVVITKDMLISEVIQRKPRTIQTLMMAGLGCIGCPSALMETVEEAAWVHGIDPDALIERLNEC